MRILLFFQLQPFEQQVGVRFARVKRSEEIERFAHGDLVREIGRLQTRADPVLQCFLLPVRIEVEHPHFAGRARTKSLEDLNGCCLARTIWPEQSKDLSSLHLEIDSFNRFKSAVRFAQTLYVNGGIRIHGSTAVCEN